MSLGRITTYNRNRHLRIVARRDRAGVAPNSKDRDDSRKELPAVRNGDSRGKVQTMKSSYPGLFRMAFAILLVHRA